MIYLLFISIIRYSIATNTKTLCFMQLIQQSLPFSRMAAAVPCLQHPSRTVNSSCLVGAVINHLTLWSSTLVVPSSLRTPKKDAGGLSKTLQERR